MAIFLQAVQREKLTEENKGKHKENKMNFEGVYLKDSWTDLAWKMSHPEEFLTEKNGLYLFSHY